MFSSGLDIVVTIRGVKKNPHIKDDVKKFKRQDVDKSLIYLSKKHGILRN